MSTLEEVIANTVKTAIADALRDQTPIPTTATTDDAVVLDVPGLAAYLGIGRNQAYALVNKPDCPFPVRRIGNRILIARAGVRRWLETGDTTRVTPDPMPASARLRLANRVAAD